MIVAIFAFGMILAIFFLTQIARQFSPKEQPDEQKRTAGNLPQSADSPLIKDNAFLPETSPYSPFSPGPNGSGLLSPQTGSSPQNTPFDILDNISRIIGPTSITPLPTRETLPLPQVSTSEFPIENSGARTLREYMTQIAVNSPRVSLTKKEFDQLLKRANRQILLPQELIELALQENSFLKIQPSLRVFLGLYAKQDALLKSIQVSSPGVSIAERMIGIERLTVTLMRNAIEVGARTMSEKEFRDFYEKYQNTSRAVRDALTANPPPRESRSLAEHIEGGVERLSGIFSGFIPSAFAQMGGMGSQPLGGNIDEVGSDNCYCSGEEVTLEENYVQGGATDFLYPYSVMVSGTYENRAVEQNTCVLGTYSQSGTCVSGEYCDEEETEDGTISLIGTAQSDSECSSGSSGGSGSTGGGGSSGSGF